MNLENHEIFTEELNQISDEKLRSFVTYCLDNAPKYFYHIPASSSGKYHPKQDLGEGGLVRHTKAVVKVGLDLLGCEQFVEDNNYNRDIVISAGLLHDLLKSGTTDTGHTIFEHPKLAVKFIGECMNNYKNKKDLQIPIMYSIIRCVERHMGKWNTNKERNQKLYKPETPIEKLVHLADYIASRKYINFEDLRQGDK